MADEIADEVGLLPVARADFHRVTLLVASAALLARVRELAALPLGVPAVDPHIAEVGHVHRVVTLAEEHEAHHVHRVEMDGEHVAHHVPSVTLGPVELGAPRVVSLKLRLLHLLKLCQRVVEQSQLYHLSKM